MNVVITHAYIAGTSASVAVLSNTDSLSTGNFVDNMVLGPPAAFMTGANAANLAYCGNRGSANVVGCTITSAISATSFQVNGTPQIFTVTADFTLAANTNLQTITGLSWTLAANTVQKVPFSCHLMYSQATAAVADQFGIQAASLAPTNIAAKSQADISASTFTAGNLPTLTTTTATPIVTFTPSAITTVWNADIDGMIENPSGIANTINIMAHQSNAADLLTIKRDSFCRIF